MDRHCRYLLIRHCWSSVTCVPPLCSITYWLHVMRSPRPGQLREEVQASHFLLTFRFLFSFGQLSERSNINGSNSKQFSLHLIWRRNTLGSIYGSGVGPLCLPAPFISSDYDL